MKTKMKKNEIDNNLIEDKKNNDLIDEEEGIENLDLREPDAQDMEYPNDNIK